MDAQERELFADALVGTLEGAADVDAALDGLGWDDAFADDPQVAVSVLFEWQGRTARSSGALHRVMGGALAPPIGASGPLALSASGAGAGLDPRLGLVAASGEVASGDALAAGQRALAHELVGASRAMLDLAREHALDRIQFGVPIASFQAVRHRLAESLVAIESAAGLVDAAWEQQDQLSAAIAKAVAGRSAHTVARHCQQVLAGIGFTAEHPLHLYVRRTRLLDALLGDARTLTRQLGEQLLATRELPPLLPL